MPPSSAQFARRVFDALTRIEPSFVRRTNGVSKGGGTHSNVVQFGTGAESPTQGVIYDGPDVSYLSTGDDQGAFLVNRAGVYTVSVTAGATTGTTVAIKAGATVDNTLADATQRSAHKDVTTPSIINATWTGYLAAGDHIWVHNSATPSAVVDDNQISILRHP